jgi:hypothetical protein
MEVTPSTCPAQGRAGCPQPAAVEAHLSLTRWRCLMTQSAIKIRSLPRSPPMPGPRHSDAAPAIPSKRASFQIIRSNSPLPLPLCTSAAKPNLPAPRIPQLETLNLKPLTLSAPTASPKTPHSSSAPKSDPASPHPPHCRAPEKTPPQPSPPPHPALSHTPWQTPPSPDW